MAARERRVFEQPARIGLADAAPSGRARLDALARHAQDAAYADVEDAGLADAAVWVLRRSRIVVDRFPRFAERLTAATTCTGVGRMWAERTTTLTGEQGSVRTVGLWVHLDPESLRPVPLTDAEIAIYGASAGGRSVRARLSHPAPDAAAAVAPWTFRAADLDLAGHVNNAAYWAVVEEGLVDEDPPALEAEIEHRSPAQAGPVEVLRDGDRLWVRGDGAEIHASVIRLR